MQNIEYGVYLGKDNPNNTYWVKDLYIWGNFMDRGTLIYNYGNYTENIDFFLRAPSLELDGFSYTPYPYPHPLTQED
jgi:hypothetical protein